MVLQSPVTVNSVRQVAQEIREPIDVEDERLQLSMLDLGYGFGVRAV